ncbi:hypothetical protein BC829DRAFT_437615 [Chytridium lagenaria]|nr:hypothetical protein BC829DRAFT_437615 [Chytridium lagenaria]
MNNLPAEVKQREAFTQDDILGAVARGSLEEVRRVKKETGFKRAGGETLLHVALLMNSEKHDEIAEYLVAKRPNLVNAVYEGANFTGEHCCHLLAVQNKLHMLKWFIKHGADVHNARATGKFFRPSGTLYFGETVLAFAACMGHFDIVRYLTEKVGIDPNTIDHQGNNILHVLAFWGYYNDTRARHPDREDYRTKSHSTLGGIYLYLPVARGHTEMVNAMMNTRRETLWVYGKASAFLYDLSEVDTFVDPVTMGHAKGALEIAIKQKNRDVLNLPLFQRILEAKWISYGRAMFTFNVFRSISYYILFTAVIYLVPNGSDYYRADLPDSSRKDYFWGPSAGESAVQWINMVLVGCIVLARMVSRSDFENLLLGLHAVFGWISLLNLTVGNRSMGTLWIIFIKVVTGDLLRFLLLMLVFILGFGEALWLQMHQERAESFDNGKADWKDLPLAFVWSFRILMQQGVYDDFRRPVNNWLSILLFMVLFFILMILLLNVFLAMLNQTFSKIMEDTEKQWRVTWAQLILTYDEALLSEYYEKLRHGRIHRFPISRIGFPRKIG